MKPDRQRCLTVRGTLRGTGLPLLLLMLLLVTGCSAGQAVVSGRITDAASGAALEEARVVVGERSVETDDEGRYKLRLPLGAHRLDVSRDGYVAQALEVALDGADDHVQDVALARRRLAVHLTDGESGAALAGAQAALGESVARSDAQGTLEIEAHVAAPLVVSAAGYLPMEVAPDDVEAAFASSGGASAALELALTPRVLQGAVTTGEGAPVPGTTVSVGGATAQTDAQGRYRLVGAEPGAAIVVQGSAHRPVEGPIYEGQERQDVIVEPWRLALTVMDESGQPLPGATVAVGDQTAVTDEVGRVEVQPHRGVSITVSRDGYAPVTPVYDGEETLGVSLARARLEAHVRNAATGEPVKRARALVYREGSDEPEVLAIDAEGYFAVEDSRGVNGLVIMAPGHRRHEVPVTVATSLEIDIPPFGARALYIPFMLLALPDRIDEILTLVDESEELNAVVLDVKGDNSWIAWDSAVPLAQEMDVKYNGLMDLNEFLRLCEERDIYVIARMVMFKDDNLASAHPEWAAVYADGRPYVDLEGLRWVDPFLREVRDYNLGLIGEVARMGFDEVQLDYIRFPSDGSTRGLSFSQESTLETRTQALGEFCAEVAAVIAPTPAFYSVDVFGLMVWLDSARDMGIGQRLEDMAPHLDYISPMLYPTTFGPGNLGYDNPGLYPWEVVYRSVRKTQERSDTLVRPWLQH